MIAGKVIMRLYELRLGYYVTDGQRLSNGIEDNIYKDHD